MHYEKLESPVMIENEKKKGPTKKQLSVNIYFGFHHMAEIYDTKLKYSKNSKRYHAYGNGPNDRISFRKEDISEISQMYIEETHTKYTDIIIRHKNDI